MIWSSFIAMPFGFGELYFVPDYWQPQTLFDFAATYHLAIESFLLMFFIGGLGSIVYEVALKKRSLRHYMCCAERCYCYLSLAVALASFIIILRAFPSWNIIYPSVFACLAGGLFAFIVYPKLRAHILFGGIAFMALYWISLAAIEAFLPGWISATWNLSTLSGMTLLKVPLEEVLFGFAFGTLWSPLYEEVCSNFSVRRF